MEILVVRRDSRACAVKNTTKKIDGTRTVLICRYKGCDKRRNEEIKDIEEIREEDTRKWGRMRMEHEEQRGEHKEEEGEDEVRTLYIS